MNALASLACGRHVAGGFALDHGHAHCGRYLGMELDRHRHGAEFLDRMAQFDLALVHFDPLTRYGFGDVLGRHGPEQFVVLSNLDRNRHGDGADLLRELFQGGLLFARLFGDHALGMFDRLQAAAGRLYGLVAGEEIIAGIARSNIKNIPYGAYSLHVLWGEEEILQAQGVNVNEGSNILGSSCCLPHSNCLYTLDFLTPSWVLGL